MNAIEHLLGALRSHECQPGRSGGGWLSRCPAHGGADPSVRIELSDLGRLVVRCSEGCTPTAVFRAMGIVASDLGDEKPGTNPPNAADVRVPEVPIFAPVSAVDLVREYPELRPVVIGDLLRRGEVMNVVAAPKVGKTWTVHALVVAIASGKHWLGKPTTPGTVLLIDAELHKETLARRLHATKEAAGATDADLEAVEAWIQARAGSLATIKAYRKEAHRLLLWLRYERHERQLGEMTVGDCADFMAFLEQVPDRWISRTRAAPGTPGWAPFMGQLSKKSRRQAITIIAALFTWLQSAQYIQANPWVLLNQKTGDDRDDYMLDSKAISEPAMDQILRFIEAQTPSPSRSRMLFILRFVEAVGLRSAEIVSAKLGDIHLETEGWVMSVHGKGAKNRIAAIPGQGFSALQDYLFARGLGGIEHAPSDAPLLASALDPMEPVGYQALYETVKNWLKKAIAEIVLPSSERLKLYRASTHWLRHTFGTRAIAREVPLDVIQAQMGHASIQTTTAIYGRAPIRRRVSELGKAFG